MTKPNVHILLVEDNDIDAESMVRAFAKNKIPNPLHRARNGVEALAMLRGQNDTDAVPTPRIAIIDLEMPVMNGLELLEKIREDKSLNSTVTFVLTSSQDQRDMAKAYALNVAGYLQKTRVSSDFLRIVAMLNTFWDAVEFPAPKPG